MEKRYILCPRCGLNYIEESEEYCTVCKAELGLIDPSILIPEDDVDSSEKLCPVCKINYISDDETMCFMCAKECEKQKAEEDAESGDEWHEEFAEPADDDDEPLSLEGLGEEELEEEDEEEEVSAEPDDFDFSNVDPNDFEEDEELEEEDEEDDDK